MGDDVYISDNIDIVNMNVLTKFDKKIKPKKCDFFFRVKTKTMLEMCKNIKSSNSNANTIQMFIKPMDETERKDEADNKFLNEVEIMIDCLNGRQYALRLL